MGLMDGKVALIFGVANKNSIAWGITQKLHEQGATILLSYGAEVLEKRVKPGEQHRMHGNRAPVRGKPGRHFHLDGLQRVIGDGRGKIGKDAIHLGQQAAAFLQRHHDIFKAGRRRIFRDRDDLGSVLGEREGVGGRKMLRPEPVQRRRSVGRRPVFEKGIGHTGNIERVSGFPIPWRRRR